MSWYRATRTVVIVDVVESVRLMQEFEEATIARWRGFVEVCREQILPRWQGRLVKSLGDGLLLEFLGPREAALAALDIQRQMKASNAQFTPDTALHLRIGVHETELVVDALDIYGSGVNLAARLATLAGPGEIIVSPEARDALVPGLDVEIEDLGDCYLKHFNQPHRAYRIGPVGIESVVWSSKMTGASDRVLIAVIPFNVSSGAEDRQLLGEVMADDLIAQLSQLQQLHVISRLSTTAFRGRELELPLLTSALGCNYLVHGTCISSGDKFRLRAQLVNCATAEVIWADGLDGTVAEALGATSNVIDRMTEQVCHALLEVEVRRAMTLPLPTLQSYTILLGAIAAMHRLSPRDSERARGMLDYLIERHPRATAPRAWLGKWHVLRVAQGWSPDPIGDSKAARHVVSKALDLEPEHSLSLAIDGLICAYINKDLSTAEVRYDAAISANPSESLAWLFKSALHSYKCEGQEAVECALRAQRLSPLDPMKYYYDNFTSTAMLSANDYTGAIDFGKRSLRANRTHGPTLRILAIAQVLGGHIAEARETVAQMKTIEPDLTVSKFLARYPGSKAPHAAAYGGALRAAGLPN